MDSSRMDIQSMEDSRPTICSSCGIDEYAHVFAMIAIQDDEWLCHDCVAKENTDLRAETARLKEKCEALEELVDCLEESTDGYWREHDDKLLAARARLAALGG